MADLAAPTRCKIIRPIMTEPMVAAAAGAAAVGFVVAVDTDGKAALAQASGSAGADEELGGIVVSVDGNGANGAITVLRKGLVDVGDILADLAYGAPVYLSGATAGRLADAAATQVIKIGRVWPVWNNTSQPDKALMVDVGP